MRKQNKLKNTLENGFLIQILKGIHDEKWSEYMVFSDIEQCIRSIFRTSLDIGCFIKRVIKIKKQNSSYVVMTNGNLIFDKRIRQQGRAYIVEHLNCDASRRLERDFSVLLDESKHKGVTA